MYKPLFNQCKALRFRKFTRKRYALFACLGKVVTIGVLSVATLVRRLPKTTSSLDADTKMVLIKGEDILNRPLAEWLEAAKIYLTGGYIAIEKPHNAHLVHLMEKNHGKVL